MREKCVPGTTVLRPRSITRRALGHSARHSPFPHSTFCWILDIGSISQGNRQKKKTANITVTNQGRLLSGHGPTFRTRLSPLLLPSLHTPSTFDGVFLAGTFSIFSKDQNKMDHHTH